MKQLLITLGFGLALGLQLQAARADDKTPAAPTTPGKSAPLPLNLGGKPPAAPVKDDGRLKTGVLSSTGKYSYTANVNQVSTSAAGEEDSPVAGSVRVGKDGCTATIRNMSKKDSYSVSYEVVGTTQSGSTALRETYSDTLKPGASADHHVNCSSGLNMAVVLRSGRKVK